MRASVHVPHAWGAGNKTKEECVAAGERARANTGEKKNPNTLYLNIWLLPFKRLNIKFQLTFQLSETFLAINHDIICKLKILCAARYVRARENEGKNVGSCISLQSFFFRCLCVCIHPMHLTRAFRCEPCIAVLRNGKRECVCGGSVKLQKKRHGLGRLKCLIYRSLVWFFERKHKKNVIFPTRNHTIKIQLKTLYERLLLLFAWRTHSD